MKTHELFKIEEEDLSQKLLAMKDKEVQKHAEKLAKKYHLNLSNLITVCAEAMFSEQNHSSLVEYARESLLNHFENVKARITDVEAEMMSVIVFILIHKKTQKIRSEANNF